MHASEWANHTAAIFKKGSQKIFAFANIDLPTAGIKINISY